MTALLNQIGDFDMRVKVQHIDRVCLVTGGGL